MTLTSQQETDFYLQLSTQWAKSLFELETETQQVEWLLYAVEQQIQQFEHLAPEQTQQSIACKEGCGHCCFLPVKVLPSQARYIVKQFSKEQQQTLKKVFIDYEQNKVNKKQPCPFLKDQCCSIYAIRPLSCRTFTSPDVNLCKTNLLFSTQIPQQAFRYQTYQAAMVALQAVAKKKGETFQQVEFVESMLSELNKDHYANES